jgi:hypothetical protein
LQSNIDGELSVKVIGWRFAFPFIIDLQPDVSNPFHLPLRTEPYDPHSIAGMAVTDRAFPGMARTLSLCSPHPRIILRKYPTVGPPVLMALGGVVAEGPIPSAGGGNDSDPEIDAPLESIGADPRRDRSPSLSIPCATFG